jgi:predicted metal-dependent peptidase
MPKVHERPSLRAWLDEFVRQEEFLLRYPYYAHVIAALDPVLDPSVPAMGVSLHGIPGRGGRYYLHVNIEQLLREPRFLRGIFVHEIHHIVLGHLAHPKFFVTEQRDLMQIAQETTANEHIEEPLPAPVLWQHFARFGLRAGQSTMERYEKLCQARSEGFEILLERDTRPVDEHRWQEQPDAPSSGVHVTRDLIDQVRERAEADVRRAAALDSKSALLAGHTPEELLAQLTRTSGAPDTFIDWREALRMFVAHTRAPIHTWSRPNRRFPTRIGEIPGRSYRPRTGFRPTILVAIDTSLSMTERELSEVARQLRPMSELAELVVAECDIAIARVYRFRRALENVKGRGGTDLRPVFEPRFIRTWSLDGIIYFTDGEGPYPKYQPSIPVLWMLTKPNAFSCPWGSRAHLLRAGITPRATHKS